MAQSREDAPISSTIGFTPTLLNSYAAVNPAGPAPIITTFSILDGTPIRCSLFIIRQVKLGFMRAVDGQTFARIKPI